MDLAHRHRLPICGDAAATAIPAEGLRKEEKDYEKTVAGLTRSRDEKQSEVDEMEPEMKRREERKEEEEKEEETFLGQVMLRPPPLSVCTQS